MMAGREPQPHDYRLTQRALALLSAYEFGCREDDFDDFLTLLRTEENPDAMLQATTQLAWMMMKTAEASGRVSSDEILQWYGMNFATKAER
jgi:hypothetical protein